LDVAVHDDDIFILTSKPTGTQWQRWRVYIVHQRVISNPHRVPGS
jgi:hypothetical protein